MSARTSDGSLPPDLTDPNLCDGETLEERQWRDAQPELVDVHAPGFRRTDGEEWSRPGVTAEMVRRYKAAILAARVQPTTDTRRRRWHHEVAPVQSWQCVEVTP